MNKRALCLVIFAGLFLSGLVWAIGAVQDLRQTVAGHGARIEHLERR